MKKIIIVHILFFHMQLWCDLAITPSLLEFKDNDKFNEVTIKNTGDRNRLFNISIKKWRQQDGKDSYENTDDLIVMPVTTEVKANSEKMIRVIVKKPIIEKIQSSYRLFIREVPSENKNISKGVSFQFLFNIIISVFTYGKNFSLNEDISYDAKYDINNNKLLVTLSNNGNKHILLNKINVKPISDTIYNNLQYVLPGSFYKMDFPLTSKKSIINEITLNLSVNEKMISKKIKIIPTK